jgi:hypothetical protein
MIRPSVQNWSREAIVVRHCQVLLDFEVLDRWDHELSQMNLGKVGEPYYYPDSFIEILRFLKIYFHLSYREIPYRQTQDIIKPHANILNTPHYSTISRRINKLDIKINEKLGDDIVIALDSTGIKLANKEEWMRRKWHVRKGYLKINISQKTHEIRIIRKSYLFLDITSEEVYNGKIRD